MHIERLSFVAHSKSTAREKENAFGAFGRMNPQLDIPTPIFPTRLIASEREPVGEAKKCE